MTVVEIRWSWKGFFLSSHDSSVCTLFDVLFWREIEEYSCVRMCDTSHIHGSTQTRRVSTVDSSCGEVTGHLSSTSRESSSRAHGQLCVSVSLEETRTIISLHKRSETSIRRSPGRLVPCTAWCIDVPFIWTSYISGSDIVSSGLIQRILLAQTCAHPHPLWSCGVSCIGLPVIPVNCILSAVGPIQLRSPMYTPKKTWLTNPKHFVHISVTPISISYSHNNVVALEKNLLCFKRDLFEYMSHTTCITAFMRGTFLIWNKYKYN